MWIQLSSADIGRAKQDLDNRRAATIGRHAQELENLQTKQKEEMENLNAKQAEIELLDTMIERFTAEFKENPAATDVLDEAETNLAEIEPQARDNEKAEEADQGTAVDLPAARNPSLLEVRFPSPNFGAFRRFG